MRFLMTGLGLCLERRLKSIKGWAILLLLPLLVFCGKLALPAQEVSAPVQVGVALPETGAEPLWALLEARSDAVLTFHAADPDTLTRNVAAGRWDCGLLVPDDFAQRLENNDTDEIFTVLISSGSSVYPLVQETVAACTAQLVSGHIARDYLLDSGIVESEAALEAMQFRLEAVEDTALRVEISLSTVDGQPLAPFQLADAGVSALLQWLVCAALTVWMLLCSADLTRWSVTPAAMRLRPVRAASVLFLSRVGADGLLALVAGWLAMAILGASPAAYLAVFAYVLLWLSAAVLLAHFPVSQTVLPVLMPFVVVVSLLMSGALVDMSLVLPFPASIARAFPSRLFLDGCAGAYINTLWLMGGSLSFGGLAVLLDMLPHRRK